MPALLERTRRLLPGLWAGWLLCVALLATPAVFAQLSGAEAGRLVGRMLAQEAYTSLALGVLLLGLERCGGTPRGRSRHRAAVQHRAWCWRWAPCSARWRATSASSR